MDGFGMVLIMRRAASLYTTPEPFHARPLWSLVDSDLRYQPDADREYWTARLADRPEPARIIELADRPADATHRHRIVADAPSRLVIAGVAAYLHRLTGERDLLLALPMSARTEPELRAIPGMVSNVLPLRLTVRPSNSLSELVSLVSHEVRAMLGHSRYRGEQLARDLGLSLRELVGPTVNAIGF